MPAVLRTAKAHAEEVRRRQALLSKEQRADPRFAVDSLNWARWFAIEHEEARRRGVDHNLPPPALVVRDEATFVPDAHTRLWTGDRLLVVTPGAVREATEARFRAVSRAGRLAGWRIDV